jgi:hypothetical protein
VGLVVTLEAAADKQADVEEFLPDPTNDAIIDFFADDAGRSAQFQGKVAQPAPASCSASHRISSTSTGALAPARKGS